jgi:nucleotide-binding universal stress UspA family protein
MHDETLRMARAVRLAQMVREFHVGTERLQMLEGTPENKLPGIIAARGYDLLALGAMTHRTGFAALFADLSNRLVDAGEGDVLLVSPPCTAEVAERDANVSARPGPSRAAATRPH